MTRCTVTYTRRARLDLAEEWLNAADRDAVTVASNAIDRILAVDPTTKGVEISEGLRRLIEPPLEVHFSVEEDDRTVTVWTVRRFDQNSRP